MQVNDLVKVSAPGHEHEGRAGIVQESGGGVAMVKLDADGVNPETIEGFDHAELSFLGR